MSFLMFNYGEQVFGEAGVGKTAGQNLILKLYKNNHALADDDDETDYTEADFTGYPSGGITLTAANWSCTPGAPTLLQYAEQLFQSTADQTAQPIYGYILVQVTSGHPVCGWRFDDGPYSISKNGDKIYTTPKINLKKPGE